MSEAMVDGTFASLVSLASLAGRITLALSNRSIPQGDRIAGDALVSTWCDKVASPLNGGYRTLWVVPADGSPSLMFRVGVWA